MKQHRGFSLLELMLVVIIIAIIAVSWVKMMQSRSGGSLVAKTAAQYELLLSASANYKLDTTLNPTVGSNWSWLQNAGYLPQGYANNSGAIYNPWRRAFSLSLPNNGSVVVSSQVPTNEVAKQLVSQLPNGYIVNGTTVNAFISMTKSTQYMKDLIVQNIPVYIAQKPWVTIIRDKCPEGYEAQIQADINSHTGASISNFPGGVNPYLNNYRLEARWWGWNSHGGGIANMGSPFLVHPIIHHIHTNDIDNLVDQNGNKITADTNTKVYHNVYLGLLVPALVNVAFGDNDFQGLDKHDMSPSLIPMLMNGTYDGYPTNYLNGVTKLGWWGSQDLYVWLYSPYKNLMKAFSDTQSAKSFFDLGGDYTSAYLLQYRVLAGSQQKNFECTPNMSFKPDGADASVNCANQSGTWGTGFSKTPWMRPDGTFPSVINANANYAYPYFGLLTVRTWCQSTANSGSNLYPQYIPN